MDTPQVTTPPSATTVDGDITISDNNVELHLSDVNGIKQDPEIAAIEDLSSEVETSINGTPQDPKSNGVIHQQHSRNLTPQSDNNDNVLEQVEEERELSRKRQNHLSDLPKLEASEPQPADLPSPADVKTPMPPQSTKPGKQSKKKRSKDVWTTTSRKGKKKTKHASNTNQNSKNATNPEDKVLITPIPRFPDKNDDSEGLTICLSKVYKAEKVEVSDDRMTAGSTKGYRMVRATRGVSDGAWYFEIKVVQLGETGHTRLGWSTDKGDLQAPVGYDGNSFGYRDVDGSKVHKALREKYGDEGYKEGDVIGFYINLPDGETYAPNPPRLVWYKGQRYVCAPDAKEDPPKAVPGSEISFFRNGICQGIAFKDLYGGRYYPAASMYTLPNQPNCVVKFNFGPDFDMFPDDFGERPVPRPMNEVPYQGYDGRVDNSVSTEKE